SNRIARTLCRIDRMPSTDLLLYIFSSTRLPLAVQVGRWVQESPRFREFAETYRDKIHKKVRTVTDADGYRDLQAELATAYFLVQERRFIVEYEKYGVGKQRGPDLSVTYKTHIRFDVEVTRLRGSQIGEEGAGPEPSKLVNTLCAKLQQLPPSIMNVLVLVADDAPYSEENLTSGLRLLQERYEHKDDDFFTRRGFLGSRDFLRHYSRLSAIRLVAPGGLPVLRLQPQARHPLPPDLATILRR
ncbi:MAG: hypothetical protein M3328_12700, partial [Chloroflexota bacterium]|nr:hypothetical protein [Chloroflexota bacterium]